MAEAELSSASAVPGAEAEAEQRAMPWSGFDIEFMRQWSKDTRWKVTNENEERRVGLFAIAGWEGIFFRNISLVRLRSSSHFS